MCMCAMNSKGQSNLFQPLFDFFFLTKMVRVRYCSQHFKVFSLYQLFLLVSIAIIQTLPIFFLLDISFLIKIDILIKRKHM